MLNLFINSDPCDFNHDEFFGYSGKADVIIIFLMNLKNLQHRLKSNILCVQEVVTHFM